MRDLAPDITRQRLLIEGYYTTAGDRALVERYLPELARHLELGVYGKPLVHAPAGAGKADNQGFAPEDAVEFTRRFFLASDLESRAF